MTFVALVACFLAQKKQFNNDGNNIDDDNASCSGVQIRRDVNVDRLFG